MSRMPQLDIYVVGHVNEMKRENAELRRRLERMAEVNACLKELPDRERKEANGK